MKHLQKLFLYTRHKPSSILVISVWVMVFFSILCVGLYGIISSQIRLSKRLQDYAVSEYLAKAALNFVSQEQANDETTYDSLYELRTKRERTLGNGKFSFYLIDEESKININSAASEIIERLPGLNTELAVLITEAGVRPYHAKEEILLVGDITDEIFEQCKNFITIYSNEKVNINTAPFETFIALGLDEQTATAIVDLRKGIDNEEGTQDDEIFEEVGQLIDKMRAFRGISEAQEAAILALISQSVLTTESKNFTLEIDTQVLSKPSIKYSIVIDEEKAKEWREY